MKKFTLFLSLALCVFLSACGGDSARRPEDEIFVSAEFQGEALRNRVPGFTREVENELTVRLIKETVKVKNLDTYEGKELTELRKKILEEKEDKIFRGTDFTEEERNLIKEKSSISYGKDGIDYREEGNVKMPTDVEPDEERQ